MSRDPAISVPLLLQIEPLRVGECRIDLDQDHRSESNLIFGGMAHMLRNGTIDLI